MTKQPMMGIVFYGYRADDGKRAFSYLEETDFPFYRVPVGFESPKRELYKSWGVANPRLEDFQSLGMCNEVQLPFWNQEQTSMKVWRIQVNLTLFRQNKDQLPLPNVNFLTMLELKRCAFGNMRRPSDMIYHPRVGAFWAYLKRGVT